MLLKLHSSLAVRVGDWLKNEIVEPAGVSETDLAAHFGVSRQALSMLLNGKASLSAVMAIRFEKAFAIKADTLLQMQTAYELAQARAHEDDIKVSKSQRRPDQQKYTDTRGRGLCSALEMPRQGSVAQDTEPGAIVSGILQGQEQDFKRPASRDPQ